MTNKKRNFSKLATIGFSVVSLSLSIFACSAQAFNLVFNGNFESTVGTGQIGYNGTTLANWTSTNSGNNAYNFIFNSGSADTTGVNGSYGNLKLWGPNDGSANGLPASSPTGGNFIGADGAFQQGAISQTISGLTVGQTYTLNFYWAGAQQSGFSGATTDQFQVTLGSQTQSTSILNNVSQGFTGWKYVAMNFKATSTSDLLSFLAIGTPNGVPPFSLLDGVSLDVAVPEPEMLLPAALLVGSVLGVRLTRKQKRA